jgi:hypothetical protein
MVQNEIKLAFIELGKFLSQFTNENLEKNNTVLINEKFYDEFSNLILLSQSHNGWFTPEQVRFSIASWANALTEPNLTKWLANYNFYSKTPKNIGLILAGNIPLVGFHDVLSVLISGHNARIKTSSNDNYLLQFCTNYLTTIASKLIPKISYIEGKLENFDAVIATGSNNTARYFEYYFGNKPNIIRRNRNSVAVLNGEETFNDLVHLGEDIFSYFGLGCRNVSKLFVPKDYNFELFFKAMFEYRDIIKYEKYANNYDYNKAVFLMSNFKILDNDFLTIKEDSSYSSPISSVFYEFYSNFAEIEQKLNKDASKLQCVVSNNLIKNSVPFGKTQRPNLWDYADNVDTLAFLSKL